MNKVSTTGIVIIAICKPLYGRLAATLAVSIKNQTPDLPICLIHDNVSLKDLSKRQRALFDHQIFIPSDTTLTDPQNAFKLKTEIYRHSPFDRTILLDSDCIMVPGKSAKQWFTELEGIKFTACCNGYYDFKNNSQTRDDYPYWADPLDAKAHFKIADDSKFYQINSSFIYFEKCQQVEELFRIARSTWNDNTFVSGQYRNSKTDEFCFNVACALTKIFPHQSPYRPLFFFFNSEKVSEPYIFDNYLALSVICDTPEQRIIDIYNRLMEYYFAKFGFREMFYYSDKAEKEKRPIRGFWHIAQMNQWKEVVQEQLMILVNDGLYTACTEILVNVAGSAIEELKKIIEPFPKVRIAGQSDLSQYEFPALGLVKSYSMSEKFYGFYLHTKGVSNIAPDQDITHKDNWRDMLNHYVLRNWQKCFYKVSGQYDVAGVNWLEECNSWMAHFSGNFFWFDSDYIKRLPEVYSLDHKNRYDAEMWLGKGTPKVYSVANMKMDGYKSDWFPKRKIGIFWQVTEDYAGKLTLLRNSGLLNEANHSVAVTDKQLDLGGFTASTAGQYDIHIISYCTMNQDAFICLVNDTDGIFHWKQCFKILEKGYDTVIRNDKVLWATAAHINSLDNIEDLNKKFNRRFLI